MRSALEKLSIEDPNVLAHSESDYAALLPENRTAYLMTTAVRSNPR